MTASRPRKLVFYSRIDAFGDGLLRLPALRAARTAFPGTHIVYGSTHSSTLETLLRRHVDHLVDEWRTTTPVERVVADARTSQGPVMVADLRIVAPWLIATRARLAGSGVRYEANFPGFALSSGWPKIAVRPEHNAWRFHRIVERLAGRRLPFDHRLEPSDAGRAVARRIRGGDERPLVLMCANGEEFKRMGDAQVAAVAGALIDAGHRVIYVETPGGGPSRQSLGAADARIETIDPALGLQRGDLDDVFLALGEMAAAYVGVEGGMAHLMATVMAPIVIVNHGISVERWRPLSNFVEVVEARSASSGGRIADTPPALIVDAAQRLIAASRRDHSRR